MSFALTTAKLCQSLLSRFGRGGSLPGTIALKLDSEFISRFQMPKHVIVVTGTNGKTTTSNLVAESLRHAGLTVINNHRGDNLNVGIATTLASGSDYQFQIQADAVVLEVDELTLYRQFEAIRPTAVLVTNFFRDQLDRAGEMETIIRKLIEVTENYTGELVLNGDDPNVVRIGHLAQKAKVHYFSVGPNEKTQTETVEASEGKFCPVCGNRLIYDYYQYSHLGRFHCDHDDFGQIDPDIYVSNIDYQNGTFTVDDVVYHSFVNSMFAVYNCASVLGLMDVLQLPREKANEVFEQYELKEGRNEVFELSKPCVINLIKNPTGANEVMKYILDHKEEKNLCIFLNDNDQDGTDVSWIWDAHFEWLNDPSIQTIVCSGQRAYDMALRLKYEEMEDKIIVIEDAKEAVAWLDQQDKNSYIMATYTALHSTRAILRKQVKK